MVQRIDPTKYGISFSAKQCRAFRIDPQETLSWLIGQGWRRYRLMSYWNEHEKQPGEYDFASLDKQIDMVAQAGGVISLCLGARQPRWPENHWPDWAWDAAKTKRTAALLRYIEVVVRRYKDNPAIESYQLENEALLQNFGRKPEIDRKRLRQEFNLVKQLDPLKPVIMTTSTSWGMPVREPIPDRIGFSYYHVYWSKQANAYRKAGGHYVVLHRLRAWLNWQLLNRRTFIHELQCEPWAPKGIWEVSSEEQDKSMGPRHIANSFRMAKATKLYPIDIWGAEWWYWRHKHGDDSIWETVQSQVEN